MLPFRSALLQQGFHRGLFALGRLGVCLGIFACARERKSTVT